MDPGRRRAGTGTTDSPKGWDNSPLHRLRCIQLDPLDVLGTNADLVLMARQKTARRGDVYRHLLPGRAFEHFAKERCLLPAHHFPWYRRQIAQSPWWRHEERLQRLPPSTIREVLEEIRERGPIPARRLTARGSVPPLDWNGWRGTAKASSLAVEVLWSRCDVVVCGRGPEGKIYDIPERALPEHALKVEGGDFARWALLERAGAAGLLSRNAGAHWSMLSDIRKTSVPEDLLEAGALVEVRVRGLSRRYLAPADFLDRRHPRPDNRMRILGPLDPLLWDRELVRHVFGFDYVWEVYKPASSRRWGWYVCPLLHRGELVGRLEGRVTEGVLNIDRIWKERSRPLDEDALGKALERHAVACGATAVRAPKRRLWS